MRKKVSMEIIVLEVSCRNMKSAATIPPSKTKMLSCGYCKKTMPDDSLATHCKDIDGKPKLISQPYRSRLVTPLVLSARKANKTIMTTVKVYLK